MNAVMSDTKWLAELERLVGLSKNIQPAAAFIQIADKLNDEYFGVEQCRLATTDELSLLDVRDDEVPEMAYLNMGETYATTLLLTNNGLEIGCWGDWQETAEQEFCKEYDCRRCPNCGKYSPNKQNCSSCKYDLS